MRISELLREMPSADVPQLGKVGLVEALRRTAEGEFAEEFSRVEWLCSEEAAAAAKGVPALSAEVLFYAAREAMRNAARHGRGGNELRHLTLRVAVEHKAGLQVVVEDDGEGITPAEQENLVEAGRGRQGSGQGLALHSTLMAVVGGSLATESRPGQGTRVVLSLPPQV